MNIERLIREVSAEIGSPNMIKGAYRESSVSIFSVLQALEHSLLTVALDEKTVLEACKQARRHHIAAVCIPPYYVSTARRCLAGAGVGVCASIGVPNALMSYEAKLADIRYSLLSGADELDVCINTHAIKSGRLDEARKELSDMVRAAKGKAVVKAAVELSVFSEEEAKAVLHMVKDSGAAYVKIQNVLSGKAADPADVLYVKSILGNNVRVKIDGGVKTSTKAWELISAGADRIGLTATFDIAEKLEGR